MEYVMTVREYGVYGFWWACKATRERKAKAEATRRFGKGAPHLVIIVGEELPNHDINVVAERKMVGRWHNIRTKQGSDEK